jgi:mannose-6-phosphate isomerase-like protein (cupin superfamily)
MSTIGQDVAGFDSQAERPDATSDDGLRVETANHLVYRQLISAEHHGPDLSVTWVAIDGQHQPLRTDCSARAYYVLTGELSFRTGDTGFQPLHAGMATFVPRGTPYDFSGTATYLVINAPAFRPGDDIEVDPPGASCNTVGTAGGSGYTMRITLQDPVRYRRCPVRSEPVREMWKHTIGS